MCGGKKGAQGADPLDKRGRAAARLQKAMSISLTRVDQLMYRRAPVVTLCQVRRRSLHLPTYLYVQRARACLHHSLRRACCRAVLPLPVPRGARPRQLRALRRGGRAGRGARHHGQPAGAHAACTRACTQTCGGHGPAHLPFRILCPWHHVIPQRHASKCISQEPPDSTTLHTYCWLPSCRYALPCPVSACNGLCLLRRWRPSSC